MIGKVISLPPVPADPTYDITLTLTHEEYTHLLWVLSNTVKIPAMVKPTSVREGVKIHATVVAKLLKDLQAIVWEAAK